MDYEYKKRGYLLPEGCKDIIDVLKPKLQHQPKIAVLQYSTSLPPVIGELAVAQHMTVRELAALLEKKPFEIIADLIELKVIATMEQTISFEVIAQVLRKNGYIARKAA